MDKLLAFLLLAFVVVGTLAMTTVWHGYVLSVLWGWFIVPALHVPELNIPYAIGITLTINMLIDRGSDRSAGGIIVAIFIGPLVALGIGWILLHFV